MDCKKIGAFICSLRKEKSLTQAALAEMLGISNRTVSKWENGDGMPDVSMLPELAKALDVTIDELLNGEKSTALPEIKVTEVQGKDNINNIFQMMFVASLFFALFGAILGCVTELYCIWAFKILFYTHWEIIFVAVAFTAIILSALIFTLAATRLQVSYTREEIFHKAAKKGWLIGLLITLFPASFLLRIIDVARFAPPISTGLVLLALIAIAFSLLYSKIKNA